MTEWNVGTLKSRKMVADDVMSLEFELDEKKKFQAGQHMDIRLTAPDGYQAERSYSIANAPEHNDVIELGVQLLENGEVSPYLYKMPIGTKIELRGPIGYHFIWDIFIPGPLILIGGGSGMVPLMSMLRHHLNNLEEDAGREIIFLVSARTIGHVLYKEELDEISKKNPNIKIIETITDKAPENWAGYHRRVDEEMLKETIGSLLNQNPHTYICGPNPFVAAVAKHMITLGFPATSIKTERFGG
jgi:ferredoxin-NADP reductase